MSEVLRTNRVITLIVTCLGTFMVLLDTTIIVTALPTIQSHLHTNLSDLQWAADAFTLSFAALFPTGGPLGARFGGKRLFLAEWCCFCSAQCSAGLHQRSAG